MKELLKCQKDAYYDSVTLMTLSNQLKKLEGVQDAVVSMGTPMNLELLENIGMLRDGLEDAGPNDLLIAIRAETEEQCEEAYKKIDELLHAKKTSGNKKKNTVFHSISEAKENVEDLNLAVISVKGEFAAREAKEAIKRDMHVMLFSDNVTIEQEREIKQLAHDKGLLVMGPDCGTAILGGVGLCFSNQVNRGKIGLVAASGTGLQEVCVMIHQLGGGVSHAIGTGGRDLSAQIGGIMMLDGLELLESDDDTDVIVLISKPPVKEVAEKIIERVKNCSKKVVVCFIAGTKELLEGSGAVFAASLEDAAVKALACLNGEEITEAKGTIFPIDEKVIKEQAETLSPEQKYIRGLYCGGTLAAETLAECAKVVSPVVSNVAKKAEQKMEDPMTSTAHAIVDLGDDMFTVGRPHPMIEPSLRCERILQEAKDPETAVLLLDFEIGYGSNQDPAGITIDAIKKAQALAKAENRGLVIIGYIQGTDQDYQGMDDQKAILEEAGVLIAKSNLQAAEMALRIVAERV